MSLYILGCVLLIVGLSLSLHERRDVYRDTWAFLLMVCGLLFILIRAIVDLWRPL